MSSMDSNPPPKGGGSTLTIVLVIFGVLGVVCCGACGAGYYFVRQGAQKLVEGAKELSKFIQLQPAVDSTMNALRQDAAVKEALGEEIHEEGNVTYLGQGEINTSDAPFTFKITGEKGETTVTAQVTAHAKQVDGIWQVTEINVALPDGGKIKVEPVKSEAPELDFGAGDEKMPEEK